MNKQPSFAAPATNGGVAGKDDTLTLISSRENGVVKFIKSCTVYRSVHVSVYGIVVVSSKIRGNLHNEVDTVVMGVEA